MNEELMNRLKKISLYIKNNFGAEKVILFGSYAYGIPTKESDIDLFIIMKTKDKFCKEASKIRIAIDELLPDKSVDIIVRTPEFVYERINKNDFFIKDILTKGISL